MTIKIRLLYSNGGFTRRDASEHVIDPRDLVHAHTGQPLYGPDGSPMFEVERPPARPHPLILPHHPIRAEVGEIEFDHEPADGELERAFPGYLAERDRRAHNAPIERELSGLETTLPRYIEDTWSAIGIEESNLPPAMRTALTRKRELRAALK